MTTREGDLIWIRTFEQYTAERASELLSMACWSGRKCLVMRDDAKATSNGELPTLLAKARARVEARARV